MISLAPKQVNSIRYDRNPWTDGPGPDYQTRLTDVDGYLEECQTLISMKNKPFRPVTLEQAEAASRVGLIHYLPARGELHWERFHGPAPMTDRWFGRLLATLSTDPLRRAALRAAMREAR